MTRYNVIQTADFVLVVVFGPRYTKPGLPAEKTEHPLNTKRI